MRKKIIVTLFLLFCSFKGNFIFNDALDPKDRKKLLLSFQWPWEHLIPMKESWAFNFRQLCSIFNLHTYTECFDMIQSSTLTTEPSLTRTCLSIFILHLAPWWYHPLRGSEQTQGWFFETSAHPISLFWCLPLDAEVDQSASKLQLSHCRSSHGVIEANKEKQEHLKQLQ